MRQNSISFTIYLKIFHFRIDLFCELNLQNKEIRSDVFFHFWSAFCVLIALGFETGRYMLVLLGL